METNPVHGVLHDKDNYLEWSVRVKAYLMAQDRWDVVEATNEPPTPENEAAFKAWRKMNAHALRVIQTSCGPDTFSDIREITSARDAWETLAEKYKPKGPDPSDSMASVPLEEDNLDSNTESGTIQISTDIREITSDMASVPLEEYSLDSGGESEYRPGSGTSSDSSDLCCRIPHVTEREHKPDSRTKPGKRDKRGNSDDVVETCVGLYVALQNGNWNAANDFLDRQPHLKSAKITLRGMTALHVAADAGHVHIVEKLVELMSEKNLEMKDAQGFTALALASYNGNYRMAECMLGKNKDLISIGDKRGNIPVVLALYSGHLELARYLYGLTPEEILMSENWEVGASVVCEAIYSKALDIALDLVQRCPSLAVAPDRNGKSPLYAMACMPDYLRNGNRLVFWKRWIHSCIHIQSCGPVNAVHLNIQNLAGNGSQSNGIYSLSQLVSKLQTLLGIEHLYEMKLTGVQFNELLRRMSEQIMISNTRRWKTDSVHSAILRAAKEGNFEFVLDILNADPQLLWSHDKYSSNIFSFAVKYRRAKIFSLIYGLDKKHVLASARDSNENNLLHMAGMSAPSTSLNDVAGAALQMQRELQWFKEVESIAPPKAHSRINKDGLTPRELFTQNHKDMRKDGEEWMKDTATSCTVVGALIVTIMFATVFTVPGGNDQNNGFPIFLNKKLFMVFIVSDALSLFSSTTSVLMFLGILTSRYAEEDFLESLPRKMIIGLSTLFFSITTMMIAFSAALFLMLHEQSWIFKPVVCFASIPITLFVLMQFRLLVAMANSTYGPSIFNRKMKRWS